MMIHRCRRSAIDDLRKTAIHEAGHAVGAVRLRLGIKRVSVIPDMQRVGYITFQYADFSYAADCRRVIAGLCGPTAARIHCGPGGVEGSERDVHQALMLSRNLLGFEAWNRARGSLTTDQALSRVIPQEVVDRTSTAWQEAERLMEAPENQAAVMALADVLIRRRTVSGRYARRIVLDAIARYTQEKEARMSDQPQGKIPQAIPEDRRAFARAQRRQGKSIREIAALLGVSKSTADRLCKDVGPVAPGGEAGTADEPGKPRAVRRRKTDEGSGGGALVAVGLVAAGIIGRIAAARYLPSSPLHTIGPIRCPHCGNTVRMVMVPGTQRGRCTACGGEAEVGPPS
jgi:hypothetical protein